MLPNNLNVPMQPGIKDEFYSDYLVKCSLNKLPCKCAKA